MKFKFSYSILLLLLFSGEVLSQKKDKKLPVPFKVVGYYHLNSAIKDTVHADSTYLFLNKITHLNIAFLNPDLTGVFNQDLAIDTLVKKAHNKNVKVLASIAGGGSHPYYAILLQDANRNILVTNLVSLVRRYDLDGIDVDLEGSDIDKNYEIFVIELAAALKPLHKLITAAISTAYKDQLSDKALEHFDFLNIMSYDRTGPWRPNNPGNHSPYTMAVEDLEYWHTIRLIPQEKLVLGLPFYGYGFGAIDSPVISMDYKSIVSFNSNAESLDTLKLPGNVILYYNSMYTIKKKTELAINKASGVMIWQLQGDSAGDNSLLNTIQLTIRKNLNATTHKQLK